MLFDIFNIFPYYRHVNYWTGKSVRIFSRKQVISSNFRRYDVYSWVWVFAGRTLTLLFCHEAAQLCHYDKVTLEKQPLAKVLKHFWLKTKKLIVV